MNAFDCCCCELQELPRFQELIFEDFSSFILVENIFEEVVLHSVMKDIMMGQSSAFCTKKWFCGPGCCILWLPSYHWMGNVTVRHTQRIALILSLCFFVFFSVSFCSAF